MYRFLPILVIFAVVFLAISYTPIRREFVYALGISGDTTTSCCNEKEIASSDGEFDEISDSAVFNNKIIDYPKTSLAQANEAEPNIKVLGTVSANGEEKWIDVSLDEQKVRAYEGTNVIMEFPISSGKWSSTPKGIFHIWYKTKNQKMEGGSKDLGTYYNLPNVPNNMFFYGGYALHGAYWHNNFGSPMSHGCVNEPLVNAAEIFNWAGPVVPEGQNVIRASADNPGTKVYVH